MAVGERFGHISDAELDELVSYIEREVKFYHILRERSSFVDTLAKENIFWSTLTPPYFFDYNRVATSRSVA